MAILSQGFLGEAIGKLGNVVMARWRRKNIVKAYQPDPHDPQTPAQLVQRLRMKALLEILRPLNDTFIQIYNEPLSVGSTPWAIAIHQNMPAVDPTGSFDFSKFILGKSSAPALNVLNPVYDPFMDQLSADYNTGVYYLPNDDLHFIILSLIGSKSTLLLDYDLRHPAIYLPSGRVWCEVWFNDDDSFAYDNGWVINLMGHFMGAWKLGGPDQDPKIIDFGTWSMFNPVPVIPGWNLDITPDLLPLTALSYAYIDVGNKKALEFTYDPDKCSLKQGDGNTIEVRIKSLWDQSHGAVNQYDWPTDQLSYTTIQDVDAFPAPYMIIWRVLDVNHNQVAKWSKFYLGQIFWNGYMKPDEAYFKSCLSCAASFHLAFKKCGFTGSFVTLFDYFIKLFEQGEISPGHHPEPPPPEILHCFSLTQGIHGSVEVSQYTRKEGEFYYFPEGFPAQILVIPDQGYEFDQWLGPDATSIHQIDQTHFDLVMSKDMAAESSFKEHDFEELLLPKPLHGDAIVTGYDHAAPPTYYYEHNVSALIEIIPDQGYEFDKWEGPDAASVVQDDPSHFHIIMSKHMNIEATFKLIIPPPEYWQLHFIGNAQAETIVTGYHHKITLDYWFLKGTNGHVEIIPIEGWAFLAWVHDGPTIFNLTSENNWDIIISGDDTIQLNMQEL
jgi:hypothetical protein